LTGRPRVTMRQALDDPDLLGYAIAGPSWLAHRTLLIAMMGERLTDEERAIFTRLTGRAAEPLQRVEEFWGVIGRRGGKSRAAAVLAVYLATLVNYSDALTTGERPVVLCLAQNARQASIVLGYASGIIHAQPLLAELIVRESSEAIVLHNGLTLEVRPASFRGLRGMTCVACIADEAAFWYSDDSGSVNPDSEILDAIRPSLATTGGPLIVISSPYAKRGEVWNTYRRHYGSEGDPRILVAQGASRDFNPSLPQSVVDRAMERDPASAAAEYLAQFRSDIDSFATREAVEACVEFGVFERAPLSSLRYFGFVDPSGGSQDSMTLAVCHREDNRGVLDAIREARPPFSPDAVTQEFAQLLKSYRVSTVTGDRYGGEFPRELFRKWSINYSPSERSKSELYVELLPLINSGRVGLLDDRRMIAQLCGLERRTARSGKDSVDHAPGAHDDRINACAGSLVLAGSGEQPLIVTDEILANAARFSRMRGIRYGF
jgi:hypothetical protein